MFRESDTKCFFLEDLAKLPKVKILDAIATAGLFGAVSGSTLAAALTLMEAQGMEYEPWAAALYPFMDIPALVTAIVLASLYTRLMQIFFWILTSMSCMGAPLCKNRLHDFFL